MWQNPLVNEADGYIHSPEHHATAIQIRQDTGNLSEIVELVGVSRLFEHVTFIPVPFSSNRVLATNA